MKNYGTGISYPEAFITKGKQRIKQFGGTVYLKDGDNFEIEIFNPTSGHVLAKINLDGKLISYTGIVLRPGERVFLERHLDSNNKFLYSTYEVNGNNPIVKNAIRSNGKVKVDFYAEEIKLNFCNMSSITTTIVDNTYRPSIYYNSDNCSSINGYTQSANTNYSKSFTSTSLTPTLSSSSDYTSNMPNKIETGTIEKGESSNQKFEKSNRNFYSFPFYTSEWKILPFSQKPLTSSDLQQYCTNCGSKILKSTYNFCPNCGSKIE